MCKVLYSTDFYCTLASYNQACTNFLRLLTRWRSSIPASPSSPSSDAPRRLCVLQLDALQPRLVVAELHVLDRRDHRDDTDSTYVGWRLNVNLGLGGHIILLAPSLLHLLPSSLLTFLLCDIAHLSLPPLPFSIAQIFACSLIHASNPFIPLTLRISTS